MLIEKVDSKNLINFYSKNSLEIDSEHGYFGTNVESFAIVENEIIKGAVTISKYGKKNILEAIAVDEESRGQGFGKELLKFAVGKIDGSVYTISKEHDFYLKHNFKFAKNMDDMISGNCKVCTEYNKGCFPKVMVLKSTDRRKLWLEDTK